MDTASISKPSDPYNFDIKVDNGTYEVGVDTKQQYGYFENNAQGGGGGLWFEENCLVDYDGYSSLPMKVINTLREAGLTVDKDFE